MLVICDLNPLLPSLVIKSVISGELVLYVGISEGIKLLIDNFCIYGPQSITNLVS